ncbi:hypothetical protein GHT06_007459 [Daphnia sinensis]|uniref:DUF7507 domain-containing protein n=1 Tax=Daphnia sinensis TaxID=1820382 RepID=A0AAD5KE41_9CRUS|nr:hypothetical protein GHT06_007459 [Daphnia sinensis]
MTGLTISGVTLAPGASQTYQTSYTPPRATWTPTVAAMDTSKTPPPPTAWRPRRSATPKPSSFSRQQQHGGGCCGRYPELHRHGEQLGVLTLTNVSVVDPSSGLNITGVTLAPGESQVYTTSYVLTQADLDNNGQGDGYIDNIATADSDQTVALSDTESTALLRTVGLGIEKNVTSVAGGNNNLFADAAGEVIQYAIRVYNAGTVTLTGVTVTDELTGLSESVPDLAPRQCQLQHQLHLAAGRPGQQRWRRRPSGQHLGGRLGSNPGGQRQRVGTTAAVPILYVNNVPECDRWQRNGLADAVGDQLNYQIVLANPATSR